MGSKKKLLASSLFSLMLASSFFSIIQPANAQVNPALRKITGFGQDIIEADYDDIENILWVLTGEVSGSFFLGRLIAVNATSEAIIATNLIFNASSSNSMFIDMECNWPYCYVAKSDAVSDVSENGQLFRYDIQTPTSPVTASSANTCNAQTTGNCATVQTHNVGSIRTLNTGSFGGTTIISGYQSASASTGAIWVQLDGLFVDWQALTPTVNTNGAVLSSAGRTIDEISLSNQNSPNNLLVGLTTASTSASSVFHYDLDTASHVCATTESITPNPVDGSAIIVDHISLDYFYTSSGSGQIDGWNLDDCTFAYSLTSADTGLANTIYAMNIVTIGETKYLVARDSGTGGNISFMPYSGGQFTGTNHFIINSAPSSSQGLIGTGIVNAINENTGRFVNSFQTGKMFVPMTNTDRAMMVIDFGGTGDDGFDQGGGGFEPNLPDEPVTNNVGLLWCAIGFIAPDACDPDTGLPLNQDPETNGTGLFMTWFLLMFSGGVMIAISHKWNFSITQVPAEFWMGLVIFVVGIGWFLDWVADIIFYGMIVGVAGLFAFGLYRNLNRGGG